MPSREYDQRDIGETKLEVPVSPREFARDAQLSAGQTLDKEGALCQVVQESKLDVNTQAGQDQVVGLRHGDLRGHQRAPFFLQDLDHCRVLRVRTVRLGVEPSGVDDQRQRILPTPERLLAHGIVVPPGTGLTSSLTLPHAVELAAYTFSQQPANTLADQLGLGFPGRASKQPQSFGLVFMQIYGRLAHNLYMVPY